MSNPANWLTSYTSTGTTAWIGSSGSEESLSENEAIIYLGFIDPIEVPKVNSVPAKRPGVGRHPDLAAPAPAELR